MKQIKRVMPPALAVFLALVCFGYVFTCQAQKNTWTDKPNSVTIHLKNNSILPKQITLVSYFPSDSGNATTGFFIMPFASRKYTFTNGTKIYLAKKKQVDTVIGGGKLTTEPFLTLKQEDDGKSFKISN